MKIADTNRPYNWALTMVYVILGFRDEARHRLLDPVWICVLLLCVIILIFILCLLHTLPIIGGGERPLIEEEAHDSIMVYQEHGGEEVDATGYDVTVLMKHSRRKVVLSSSTMNTLENGGLGIDGVDSRGGKRLVKSSQMQGMSSYASSAGELGETGTQGMSSSGRTAGKFVGTGTQEMEGGRLEAWIMSRVREVDKDVSFLPADEMDIVRYEGKYWNFDELSDLEFDEDFDQNAGNEVWSIDWDNFRK